MAQVDARLVLAPVWRSRLDLEHLCAPISPLRVPPPPPPPCSSHHRALRCCMDVVGPMTTAVEPMYGWGDGVIATM